MHDHHANRLSRPFPSVARDQSESLNPPFIVLDQSPSELSPIFRIEAGKSEKHYWRDLWGYRELFFFLAWRDILVRYKQTLIGIAWAVLRPFLMMVVFTLIFGRLARLPSGGIPYPILVFSAMLPCLACTPSTVTPTLTVYFVL